MPVREHKLRAGQARDAPRHFAGLQFDAAEFGLRRLPAAAAVNVAIDMDRRVPVAFQPFPTGVVTPDDVVPTRFEFEQAAAGAVTLGDQDLVADDNGVSRVDALADAVPPRIMELHFPTGRVETEQAATGEMQAERAAVDRRPHRDRIAG